MNTKIAKKTIILYVLNILINYSSEEFPVTQSAIANYINDKGIPCDRKTVGRNINYLIEYGYMIVKLGRKGCYLKKSKNNDILL